MADTLISSTGNLTDNSKILVNVDHALENVLVVSYAFQSKLFQGVLLDSTNRYLPSPSPSEFLRNKSKEILIAKANLTSPPKVKSNQLNANRSAPKVLIVNPDENTNDENSVPNQDGEPKLECPDSDVPFYGLSRRFTYFQDVLVQRQILAQKSQKMMKKSQKMTVRLRPRQVLCSKCKSICNENSEKVLSKGGIKQEDDGGSGSGISSAQQAQDLLNGDSSENAAVLSPGTRWLQPRQHVFDDKQMVLRKKRSVGSMEDLWDETVFEEAAKKAKTTPIIKISFGSPGEGTVLKIPSKVQTCSDDTEEEDDDDSTCTNVTPIIANTASILVQRSTPTDGTQNLAPSNNVPCSFVSAPPLDNSDEQRPSSEVAKAYKKALKKAKKEAKRKYSLDGSPDQRTRDDSPSLQPAVNYKKHRHKVKHKRKHRSVNSDLNENANNSDDGGDSGGSSNSVPEFPAGSPLGPGDAETCCTDDGNTLHVGDIVWGKIHGFPWWPGKVESLCLRGGGGWDAQVSWFGSATSSTMSCNHLSPFLQTFKARFNKKKKSNGYKEAIRQATCEAATLSEGVPLVAEINQMLASS